MDLLRHPDKRAALRETVTLSGTAMLFLVTTTICGIVLDLELGTIPEWIAAFATVGALIAALYAGRAALGALALELDREGDRLERERQDQASRVAAWFGRKVIEPPPGSDTAPWSRPPRQVLLGAMMRNASDIPVTEVQVRFVVEKGDCPVLEVGVLPPADTPEFTQVGGADNDWTQVVEAMREFRSIPVEITFRDARGQGWTRRADGRLIDRYAAWGAADD